MSFMSCINLADMLDQHHEACSYEVSTPIRLLVRATRMRMDRGSGRWGSEFEPLSCPTLDARDSGDDRYQLVRGTWLRRMNQAY